MKLYMHHVELNVGDCVTVQVEGEYLWVEASDLPWWANAASANFALHRLITEEATERRYGDVTYIIAPVAIDPTSKYPALAVMAS